MDKKMESLIKKFMEEAQITDLEQYTIKELPIVKQVGYSLEWRGRVADFFETLGPGIVIVSCRGDLGIICASIVSMSMILEEQPRNVYLSRFMDYVDITAEWYRNKSFDKVVDKIRIGEIKKIDYRKIEEEARRFLTEELKE